MIFMLQTLRDRFVLNYRVMNLIIQKSNYVQLSLQSNYAINIQQHSYSFKSIYSFV